MSSGAIHSIPVIDAMAAEFLRGMLADPYWKPERKSDGARQAFTLARTLARRYMVQGAFSPALAASLRPCDSAIGAGMHATTILLLHFAREAIAGMLANPHTRHENSDAWVAEANSWAAAMLEVSQEATP